MGKDYKIGLAIGSVLAVAAILWVATRPSLSPEARMLRPSQAPARTGGDTPPAATGASLGTILHSSSQDTGPGAQGGQSPGPPPQTSDSSRQAAIPAPQPGGVPDLTIYEKTEKIKTTRFHFIRKQETLSAISQQYYGTPNKWPKILEANKAVIKDPNRLQPGTKLIIPE